MAEWQFGHETSQWIVSEVSDYYNNDGEHG